MIMTGLVSVSISLVLITAPVYGVIKGINFLYDDLTNKEKPVTTIKFKEWI
jgi:hypothetical protein